MKKKSEPPTVIPSGTLFLLTHGEYNDYENVYLCKALVNVDIVTVRAAYLESHPGGLNGRDDFRFFEWFVRSEYAVSVSHGGLHLSSFSDHDLVISLPQETN